MHLTRRQREPPPPGRELVGQLPDLLLPRQALPGRPRQDVQEGEVVRRRWRRQRLKTEGHVCELCRRGSVTFGPHTSSRL